MPTDSKTPVAEPQQAQPAQATAARKPARCTTGPVIMVAGLILAVVAVLFVPMMAGGATGAQASSGPVSSVASSTVAYQNLEDAAAELGYTPSLPEAGENGSITAINVLDGKVLEVVYNLNGSTLVYRTGKGAEDLSGDYTDYAFTTIAETDGITRSYAGSSETKLNLAVWASEGYAYALSAAGGLEAEAFMTLAQSIV